MIIRMIYKKPTGNFITIESELVDEDSNYLYLKCGKYLKRNILEAIEIKSKTDLQDSLTDDA